MNTNSQFTPPRNNEIEISLFGPGYGEALLIHVGNGSWVVVDSCYNPHSKKPAALDYLDRLGVNISEQVKSVIVTHWHDDHIGGVSKVYEKCESARIIISSAILESEFLTLANLYRNSDLGGISSGLDEFGRIFQILQSRKEKTRFNPPIYACADRVLLSEKLTSPDSSAVEVKIYSLSPSDASVLRSQLAFAEMANIETEQARRRIVSPGINHTSVVLWIEAGKERILLGADLENTSDQKTGWAVIVNESQVVDGRASIIKVPHHGSQNAYDPDVWSRMLTENPVAIMTPYNRGSKPLPSPEDVARITSHTSNAYITSSRSSRKVRWRERVVRDTLLEATKQVIPINNVWGQIRLRRAVSVLSQDWTTELFGQASKLEDFDV